MKWPSRSRPAATRSEWSAGTSTTVRPSVEDSGTVRGSAAMPSGVRRSTSICSAGVPTSDGRRHSISTSSPLPNDAQLGRLHRRHVGRLVRGVRERADTRLVQAASVGVGGGVGEAAVDRDRLARQALFDAELGHRLGVEHRQDDSRRTCATSSRICAISASIDSKRRSSRRRSPTSTRSRRS